MRSCFPCRWPTRGYAAVHATWLWGEAQSNPAIAPKVSARPTRKVMRFADLGLAGGRVA
jgi:hypothetical protein